MTTLSMKLAKSGFSYCRKCKEIEF